MEGVEVYKGWKGRCGSIKKDGKEDVKGYKGW